MAASRVVMRCSSCGTEWCDSCGCGPGWGQLYRKGGGVPNCKAPTKTGRAGRPRYIYSWGNSGVSSSPSGCMRW